MMYFSYFATFPIHQNAFMKNIIRKTILFLEQIEKSKKLFNVVNHIPIPTLPCWYYLMDNPPMI